MSNLMCRSDQQSPSSARCRRRFLALAGVVSLMLGSSTRAGTILQYAQVNSSDTVTATENGGHTSTSIATTGASNGGGGQSVYVQITNFLGATESNLYAYETFVGVTSVGSATALGTNVYQQFSGKVEFTSAVDGGGTNYLTASFTNSMVGTASFFGGGSTAGLMANLPTGTLTFTSDDATFGTDTGMSLDLINIAPNLSITGSSITSFTAQNGGSFSASFSPIPEPSTLVMTSIALAIGAAAYGKRRVSRRMKDEG
jgi:hypothetical protein